MKLPSNCWLYGKWPPEIAVISGIHGNESAGVDAMKSFLKSFNPTDLKKSVIFVIGNPEALEKNVRYIESDLNREFASFSSSIEGKRAKEIAEILKETKIILDLHLTQALTMEPFAISIFNQKSIDFFKKMQIPINNFVLTEKFDPGKMTADEFFFSCNPDGIAISLELGSILDKSDNPVKLGKKAIFEALKVAKAIDSKEEEILRDITFWKESQKIPNKQGTTLIKDLQNFSNVKRGQILAYDGGKPILCNADGKVLFPKYAKTNDAYLLRIIEQQSI